MIHLDHNLPLKIIGDMHYGYDFVQPRLTTPQSCNLIFLGDLGGDLKWYTDLAKRGHKVLCIRGNHDRNELFEEGEINSYFKKHGVFFLPDVSLLAHGATKIVTVGGAISIDRYICPERRNTDILKLSHLAVEKFEEDHGKADIMLSHAPPLQGYKKGSSGFFESFCEDDDTLAEDVEEEQIILQRCFDISGATRSIFGHLHRRYKIDKQQGRTYQCLDIGEILEITS